MTLEEATGQVIEALQRADVPHMLVGGLTSNFYGIPRATQDADLVVQLDRPDQLSHVGDLLGSDFEVDRQASFETLTGNTRYVVRLPSTPFVFELFVLGDDPFQHERFRRRVTLSIPSIGEAICLPTPEDVVVQKLRWGRPKDLDDARDVLAVQGDDLDMAYIERWCARHDTSDRLDAVKRQIPPL